MKCNICDVCYQTENKATYGQYTISYKNNRGMKIKLDVCEKHKDYFKVCKNFDEAHEKVNKLYNMPTKRLDLIFNT